MQHQSYKYTREQLGLRELLSPEEQQEPSTATVSQAKQGNKRERERENIPNQQLKHQSHPKPRIPQDPEPSRNIRRNRPRPNIIRRERPSTNRRNRTQHLRRHQGKADMQPGQRLQEDHPEADALEGIQDAEPEPQRAGDERPRRVQVAIAGCCCPGEGKAGA